MPFASIILEASVSTELKTISEIRSEIAGPIAIPLVHPSLAYCINLSSFRPKNRE